MLLLKRHTEDASCYQSITIFGVTIWGKHLCTSYVEKCRKLESMVLSDLEHANSVHFCEETGAYNICICSVVLSRCLFTKYF